MNKTQLILAWLTGLVISAVLMFTPKIMTWKGDLIFLTKDNKYLAPLVNWSLVGAHSLVILIIGILLIYSLRNK